MNTFPYASLFAFACLAGGGCAGTVEVSETASFPTGPVFDLDVDLALTSSFKNYTAHYQSTPYEIGPILVANATAMSESLFRQVRVVDSRPAETTADAVLTPAVRQFSDYTAPTGSEENYHGLVKVRWELRDGEGSLIWSDETEGSGHARILTIFGVDAKWRGILRDAAHRMFLQTHERIAASPEIRALAGGEAGSE